jgi:hypothetical protein
MKFQEMDFQPVQERGLWRLKCASTKAHIPNLGIDPGVEMALRRDAYAA